MLFQDMHEEFHKKKPRFYLEEHAIKLFEFGVPNLLKSEWTSCMFISKCITFWIKILREPLRIYGNFFYLCLSLILGFNLSTIWRLQVEEHYVFLVELYRFGRKIKSLLVLFSILQRLYSEAIITSNMLPADWMG